jgi:transcription elongation factor GreB
VHDIFAAVSKAFTGEEAAAPPRIVPPRAPLPPGVPNYVTARGLARLRDELDALVVERTSVATGSADPEHAEQLAVLAQRRAELEQRIASAELVPPPDSRDTVRFGASVRVSGEGGERSYRIVGVDEADASRGDIAFVSPLARALLGRSVGDAVRLRAPRGEEELEIVSVEYPAEA